MLMDHRLKFNKNLVHSMKIDFVLENSADSGEMSHYVAFYLDLHCLPSTSLGISGQSKIKNILGMITIQI